MRTPVFPVSDITLKLIKNLSAVGDQQIWLREGALQRSYDKSLAMGAVATLPEAWPRDTPIYDSVKFLGALSECAKPVIQFEKGGMIIGAAKEAHVHITIRYCDPTTLRPLPQKEPQNTPVVEFTLSAHDLQTVQKMASVLDLKHITVVVDPRDVILKALDRRNPNSNQFTLQVSNVVRHDTTFKQSLRIQVEHFNKVMDGAYTVGVHSSGNCIVMTHQTVPLVYFIARDSRPD